MRIQADFPDFQRDKMRLEEAFKHLPDWAGNAAVNFYRRSFDFRGWRDRRFERWPKRANNQDSNRGLLMKTGTLKRSIRFRVSGRTVEVFTDAKYAQAHNEGAEIKQKVTARQRRYFWAMHYKAKKSRGASNRADMWKAMALADTITIKMPKRQFMDIPGKAMSWTLEQRLVAHVERMIEHALP